MYRIYMDSHGNKFWVNDPNEPPRNAIPIIEHVKEIPMGLQDRYHREDGPAVQYWDGSKYYFLDGLPHREDGPAVDFSDGTKQWWIHGKKLTEEEFLARKPVETYISPFTGKQV